MFEEYTEGFRPVNFSGRKSERKERVLIFPVFFSIMAAFNQKLVRSCLIHKLARKVASLEITFFYKLE